MKKLFAILAVALLVAACGGGNTKEEPKSIKDQFSEYLTKMEKAYKTKNYEKAIDIYMDYNEWCDSLDEEQLEELHKAVTKAYAMNAAYMDMFNAIVDMMNYGYDDMYEDDEADVPIVYSNCYDGYLNVRAEPSSKSQILGRLTNGQGAELLGVEGNWCRVRVNGVVGYVSNSYIQSTPTDPVYIDASVVVGRWEMDYGPSNAYDILKIESNGKFVRNFYQMGVGDTMSGTWRLSYNKIVLRYSDGTTDAFTVNGKTMTRGEATFYKK